MKNTVLTCFILFAIVPFSISQNYKLVDSIVRTYPRKLSNPDDLISFVNRDFALQEEKVRAIYTWMSQNIEYDIQAIANPHGLDSLKVLEELKRRKESQFQEGIIPYTLRKGKGICIDYSILFQYFCEHSSLECEIVDGVGKNGVLNYDSIPNHVNHSWNAVKIGGEWKLIDVTWSSGYYDDKSDKMVQEFNDFYFFTPPEQFAYTHFPDDSNWLLTSKSKEKFDKAPIYYHTYFQRNVNIIKPKNGEISVGRKGIITFVITKCNDERIYFKFGNESEKRFVTPIVSNGKSTYKINYRYLKDTYLTVLLNEQRLAKYLVKE